MLFSLNDFSKALTNDINNTTNDIINDIEKLCYKPDGLLINHLLLLLVDNIPCPGQRTLYSLLSMAFSFMSWAPTDMTLGCISPVLKVEF